MTARQMKGDGIIVVPSVKSGRGTQTYVRLSVEVRGRGRAVARAYNINVEKNNYANGISKSASTVSEVSYHLPSVNSCTAEQDLS